MRKTTILLILFISTVLPSSLYAQEGMNPEEPQTSVTIESNNNQQANTKYFDITMERKGQAAWDKSLTYVIYVTPKINSTRTQIIWEAPIAIDIKPRHKEFVDLYQGQTYTFKAKIKAQREGVYELSANLIAWQHDANYTNSVSDIISFNEKLLALPVDPMYTWRLIGKYLLILSTIGLGLWILAMYGKKGLKRLKAWLTPPI